MPTKNKPLTEVQIKKIIQESVDENMILIANAFEKVATKDDLTETLKNYPTKADLQKALAPYATREDMKEIMESLAERFESSVFATLKNHETRITSLERA